MDGAAAPPTVATEMASGLRAGSNVHRRAAGDDRTTVIKISVLSPLFGQHHANAHSGLGILLLMRGDFGEGWDEYEWRLRSTERKGPRFPERPWEGENLAGKHIYVQAEQGFGDSIQFARYLPLLAARAGQVTLRGASAAGDAAAGKPGRRHRARRPRRHRPIRLRCRAAEPAAALEDAARDHSRDRALSARPGRRGRALEETARQSEGT